MLNQLGGFSPCFVFPFLCLSLLSHMSVIIIPLDKKMTSLGPQVTKNASIGIFFDRYNYQKVSLGKRITLHEKWEANKYQVTSSWKVIQISSFDGFWRRHQVDDVPLTTLESVSEANLGSPHGMTPPPIDEWTCDSWNLESRILHEYHEDTWSFSKHPKNPKNSTKQYTKFNKKSWK